MFPMTMTKVSALQSSKTKNAAGRKITTTNKKKFVIFFLMSFVANENVTLKIIFPEINPNQFGVTTKKQDGFGRVNAKIAQTRLLNIIKEYGVRLN